MTNSVITPAVSTQEAYPWRATARTVLQYIASTIVGLATLILGLNIFLPQALVAIQDALPAEWVAYATVGLAGLATIAGATARFMAIPLVNQTLAKFKLSAQPMPTLPEVPALATGGIVAAPVVAEPYEAVESIDNNLTPAAATIVYTDKQGE